MPLREMNREQVWLLPPTLDELNQYQGGIYICRRCRLA